MIEKELLNIFEQELVEELLNLKIRKIGLVLHIP